VNGGNGPFSSVYYNVEVIMGTCARVRCEQRQPSSSVCYVHTRDCVVNEVSGSSSSGHNVEAIVGTCAGVRGGRRLWASLCCVI
jgi:hypothetical protein